MAGHRARHGLEGLFRPERGLRQPDEARVRNHLMHSSLETAAPKSTAALPPALAAVDRALRVVNKIIMIVSAIAMILACFILSYSVISRSYFKTTTNKQKKASVFLLVGATFLTAAYV